MRRREFIQVVGAVVAAPLPGQAQQKAMPVIGVLVVGSPGSEASNGE
jgi:hypothetical protein